MSGPAKMDSGCLPCVPCKTKSSWEKEPFFVAGLFSTQGTQGGQYCSSTSIETGGHTKSRNDVWLRSWNTSETLIGRSLSHLGQPQHKKCPGVRSRVSQQQQRDAPDCTAQPLVRTSPSYKQSDTTSPLVSHPFSVPVQVDYGSHLLTHRVVGQHILFWSVLLTRLSAESLPLWCRLHFVWTKAVA